MSARQSRRPSWFSRGHALFSTKKGRDVPSTTQGLQKSGSVKSFTAGVAGLLLTFARKPNECLRKCWPWKSVPSRPRFELLPPELILRIEQYLSLSSALSLSYTCKRFRQTMETRVEDLSYLVAMESFLEYPMEYPVESKKESAVSFQRLFFLCLLERDGRLSASKAICSECKTTHDVSRFSSTDLQKRSHQRRCMDDSRIPWALSPQITPSFTSRCLRVAQHYKPM